MLLGGPGDDRDKLGNLEEGDRRPRAVGPLDMQYPLPLGVKRLDPKVEIDLTPVCRRPPEVKEDCRSLRLREMELGLAPANRNPSIVNLAVEIVLPRNEELVPPSQEWDITDRAAGAVRHANRTRLEQAMRGRSPNTRPRRGGMATGDTQRPWVPRAGWDERRVLIVA
jgi:hypothetical protein